MSVNLSFKSHSATTEWVRAFKASKARGEGFIQNNEAAIHAERAHMRRCGWAEGPEQTVEWYEPSHLAWRRPRDAFGHINPAAAQERHYEGHANDGGGVQAHSCGANYPYVIGQQETGLEDGSVYHFVIGGRLTEPKVLFSTLQRAQDYIDFLKAGDTLAQQDASDRREGKHIAAAIQLVAVRALGTDMAEYVKKWKTSDGKYFDSREQAESHEEDAERAAHIERVAAVVLKGCGGDGLDRDRIIKNLFSNYTVTPIDQSAFDG